MRFIITFLVAAFFMSCTYFQNKPDTSNIHIQLSTQRFEKELFALDTNQLDQSYSQLLAKYPIFGKQFNDIILNANPLWTGDTLAIYLKEFIKAYSSIYDSSEKIYSDFTPYENEIKEAFTLFAFYFPSYTLPHQIITYIGPIDGYGDILTSDAFVVGLHHHLGRESVFYSSSIFQETYPSYITKRFEPDYIVINCIKTIIEDLYPVNSAEASLISQMIEEGKRIYLLEQILPNKEKYQLLAYTEKQFQACVEHEPQIWDLFIQNNLLQTVDKNIIKNYVGEGPTTQELGKDSPGNIGAFVGWQIVKKFMEKSTSVSLDKLMKTDNDYILQKAKYKP